MGEVTNLIGYREKEIENREFRNCSARYADKAVKELQQLVMDAGQAKPIDAYRIMETVYSTIRMARRALSNEEK